MIPKNLFSVVGIFLFCCVVSCRKDKSTSNDQDPVTRNGQDLTALDMAAFAGKVSLSASGDRGVFVASREGDQIPRVYRWEKSMTSTAEDSLKSGSKLTPVPVLASATGVVLAGTQRLPEVSSFLSASGASIFFATPSSTKTNRQALYLVPFGASLDQPTPVLEDESVIAINDMVFSDSASGYAAINVMRQTPSGLVKPQVFLMQISAPEKVVLLSTAESKGERALAFKANPTKLVFEQISDAGKRTLKALDASAVDFAKTTFDYLGSTEDLYTSLTLTRDPSSPLNIANNQVFYKSMAPRSAPDAKALGNASNVETLSYPRVSHLASIDAGGALVSDPSKTVGTAVVSLSFSRDALVGAYVGRIPTVCRSEDNSSDLSPILADALVATSDGESFDPIFLARKDANSPWALSSNPCSFEGSLRTLPSLNEVVINGAATGDSHRIAVSLFENGTGYKLLLLDKTTQGYLITEL